MGVFAVYIKKEARYFGELRPFGNTYHYRTAAGQSFADQTVAEAVAEHERAVTSSEVTFTGWTTWGPTDGPDLGNVIRASGDLAGTGEGTPNAGMYREACALVVIEISRSAVLNRRRWLRKFLRSPGVAGVGLNDQVLSGGYELPAGVQADLVAYGNNIKNIFQGADDVQLCTAEGDGIPIGTDAQVRPFLFTRQIGD